MSIKEEHIRLVFGLKLKQLRMEKKLSLSELSKKTGISISYLNEIEKAKKYPKTNKIASLAAALNVDYNYLVSLKLNKKLQPIADLLNSNILHELPLDVYGFDKGHLIDILADVPTKLSAFISTLIQISRNYNMTVENFYFAVLTSYQEMHNNYFEEIEIQAANFLEEFGIDPKKPVYAEYLADVLTNHFGYEINEGTLSANPKLKDLRTVTRPGKKPVLFINENMNRKQKAFAIGLELAFNYLEIKERPFATTWVEVRSFEEVLNHFKASYFANALLMNSELLIADMEDFFNREKFDGEALIDIKEKYNASTEMFCQRLSHLMPHYFGLNELFFLTFNHEIGTNAYFLAKELHLTGLQSPHANRASEHYCRRWNAISILEELEDIQNKGLFKRPICRAQRSQYVNSSNEYLLFSFARKKLPFKTINSSISIGFLLNDQTRETIKFANDPDIPFKLVNNTCERCQLEDCAERAAPPVFLQERLNKRARLKAVKKLLDTGDLESD